mmetsp:Transcript_24533/g.38828  ORF Transcript_24533/g.38828 Transcript_24533/m.38828 type:complete len:281 (-) Transcript_24533:295-1137(-)
MHLKLPEQPLLLHSIHCSKLHFAVHLLRSPDPLVDHVLAMPAPRGIEIPQPHLSLLQPPVPKGLGQLRDQIRPTVQVARGADVAADIFLVGSEPAMLMFSEIVKQRPLVGVPQHVIRGSDIRINFGAEVGSSMDVGMVFEAEPSVCLPNLPLGRSLVQTQHSIRILWVQRKSLLQLRFPRSILWCLLLLPLRCPWLCPLPRLSLCSQLRLLLCPQLCFLLRSLPCLPLDPLLRFLLCSPQLGLPPLPFLCLPLCPHLRLSLCLQLRHLLLSQQRLSLSPL